MKILLEAGLVFVCFCLATCVSLAVWICCDYKQQYGAWPWRDN